MLPGLLERLLIDRDTLQDDLEAVLAVFAAKLAKKYGWNRETVARFLEHQVYVAALRFQTRHLPDRSALEFERALETLVMEQQVAAKVQPVKAPRVAAVKKVRKRVRRAA